MKSQETDIHSQDKCSEAKPTLSYLFFNKNLCFCWSSVRSSQLASLPKYYTLTAYCNFSRLSDTSTNMTQPHTMGFTLIIIIGDSPTSHCDACFSRRATTFKRNGSCRNPWQRRDGNASWCASQVKCTQTIHCRLLNMSN